VSAWIALAIGCLAGLVIGLLLRGRSSYQASVAEPRPDATRTDPDESEVLVREELLEAVSEGVIVLNELMLPVLANASARRHLLLEKGFGMAEIPGEIRSLARRALTSAEAVIEIVEVWSPSQMSLEVAAVPLDKGAGVVVSLRDVSSEQRVQKIRRRFVTHASHELKTPVAAIQALAEAVLEAVPDDPQAVARFAQRLVDESGRLGRLIGDLLDLSRLEDPGSFMDKPVDLRAVIDREAAEIRPAMESKGISFQTGLEPGIFTRGDDQQVALLMRNLLDNALRHTPEHGNIGVSLSRSGDRAVIAVADDGAGIPLKAQARVFERFFRVDEARSRASGGTGLGLAIVKHVADLHGGHVQLTSEFGEGSTFTVHLPLAPETIVSEES
jgi:two-component system sensor histidine kinase SenX3